MFAMLHCLLSALLGATQVWTDSSLTDPATPDPGRATASEMGRIYAARGESESLLVFIKAGNAPLDGLTLAGAPDKVLPAPSVYSVGTLQLDQPSSRALRPEARAADVLFPARPVGLPPGATAVYWVTFHVPGHVRAGVYRAALEAQWGGHKRKRIEVRVEVFDFTLPNVPSLPTLFPLDRRALRDTYGLATADLEAWQPHYDAFSGHRIAYTVWNGAPDLVRVTPDGTADTALLKEHLLYATTRASMAAVDIGGSGRAWALFPATGQGVGSDPLQGFLLDLTTWLGVRGWAGRALAEVVPIPARAGWTHARADLVRWGRTAPELPRLIAGPPHPYFEQYAEYWAIPFAAYEPDLVHRLRTGRSLAALPYPAPTTITASSCGRLPGPAGYESAPEDAADGSAYTAWLSGTPPTGNEPAWLRLNFDPPFEAERIGIVWAHGSGSLQVDVEGSFDGVLFSTVGVTWDHRAVQAPYDRRQSEGTFKVRRPFAALRLLIRGTIDNNPAGVAEVWLGDDPPADPGAIPATAPWLLLAQDAYPSLAADAHPVEARMIPWICWGHNFAGLLGRGLNGWPRHWTAAGMQSQLQAGDGGEAFLYYPGPTSAAPSVRIERLRDGLEDYEYLAAAAAAKRSGRLADPRAANLCAPHLYGPRPTEAELETLARQIEGGKVILGRALSELAEAKR